MLKELGIFRNLTLTNNLVEADKSILKAKAEVSEDYTKGKLSVYLFTKYNQKYINEQRSDFLTAAYAKSVALSDLMIKQGKEWIDKIFDDWVKSTTLFDEPVEFIPDDVEVAEVFIDTGSSELVLKEKDAEELVEHEWAKLEEMIGWEDTTKIQPGQFPSIEKIIGDDKRFPEIEKLIDQMQIIQN